MTYTKYVKTQLNANVWVITEKDKDYLHPKRKASYTFAFDTETLTYLDGEVVDDKELFKKLKDVSTADKRKRVTSKTWAFQIYDEYNGFFMTNDFLTFLDYACRCGYKYGWCYNATFDFAQIDYQILAERRDLWKPHERAKEGEAYNRHQPYTYESLHNATGSRYAYKLWIPYRNDITRKREYVHAVELRDFMKLCGGGLKRVLEDLDIRDNENVKIRKLSMEYQKVNPNNLTDAEIDYCLNDVKGLYFAVKKFNATIQEQSNGESAIYGKDTNIMTSGGFAKRELLRSLYPNVQPKYRIKFFQHDHPISEKQDAYLRDTHLYRGGITYLNPNYKGKLITDRLLYRYDVNSEYPYAMASIQDLVGYPFRISIGKWRKMSKKKQAQYECIYICNSICGQVKPNMLGIYYNPFTKDFEDIIYEDSEHLIYERELLELYNWYDLEVDVDEVILIKRGKHAYKPFVMKNYEVKAQAKRNKNKTLQQVTKLKLNSSYGKLSERVERIKGHYELNDDTGAIHFVEEGVEVDAKSIMSVLVGALVCAVSRIYILSKIREVCKNVKEDFLYCDTDSIHTFNLYKNTSDTELGWLKNETPKGIKACKYIAPKTYVDVLDIQKDGSINEKDIEIHSKGITLLAIMTELHKKKKITIKDIDEAIAYGKKYIILCAMNVKGGKVLLPTEKYIARWELGEDTCYNHTGDIYLNER